MAKIFVSYSRADHIFVDRIVSLIQKVYGKDAVWFDADIHGGADWWQMILDEIGKCDLFIYLISNESLESSYCQAELREALRLRKLILPVIVRRLKPSYPGNVDPDLADVLHRTQFVDMSGGFRDADTIAALYGSIQNLLNIAPSGTITPQTPTPVPQPAVPDKKPDSNIRAAYIAGGFALLAAIIAGIFGLWQGAFANNGDDPPNTQPAAAIADDTTELPIETTDPAATLSGFQELQTAQAHQTSAAEAQEAADLTATEDTMRSANATAIAEQIGATETAARATLIALSATPTITPTLSPEEAALTRQTSNADWQPHITEREFDGVMMVLVPAGCFMMGSTDEQIDYAVNELGASREWMDDEQPIHEICFDEPFWIDKHEVTNEQYGGASPGTDHFGNNCSEISSDNDQPRNCVDWFDATDFCEARGGRLPTEAEWEYAARGPDSLVYPWGNAYDAERVIGRDDPTYGDTSTAPVGSRLGGASWVGALDLSGNLWEWTSSLYEDYPYDETDGREDPDNRSSVRVLRGGSFNLSQYGLRGAFRLALDPDFVNFSVGLRCVRPPSLTQP